MYQKETNPECDILFSAKCFVGLSQKDKRQPHGFSPYRNMDHLFLASRSAGSGIRLLQIQMSAEQTLADKEVDAAKGNLSDQDYSEKQIFSTAPEKIINYAGADDTDRQHKREEFDRNADGIVEQNGEQNSASAKQMSDGAGKIDLQNGQAQTHTAYQKSQYQSNAGRHIACSE